MALTAPDVAAVTRSLTRASILALRSISVQWRFGSRSSTFSVKLPAPQPMSSIARAAGVAPAAPRAIRSSASAASTVAVCPVFRLETRSTSRSNRSRISSTDAFRAVFMDVQTDLIVAKTPRAAPPALAIALVSDQVFKIQIAAGKYHADRPHVLGQLVVQHRRGRHRPAGLDE